MSLVREHWGISSPTQGKVPQDLPRPQTIVRSEELLGIEVEVENVAIRTPQRKFWTVKTDGSLRNNGLEFITLPIRACDAPIALESLMKETLATDCCFSPRTSVHVHLNFADDDTSLATDVILLYTVFERNFYKFIGKNRIKNIYCVPITETNILSKLGLKGLAVDYWSKYTGLNARPLSELGTLEFRHMHGTFDVDKICTWIDIITQLKAFCKTKGTKYIRQLISSMDDDFNFNMLLFDIFDYNAPLLKYQSIEDVKFTYKIAKLGLASNKQESLLSQGLSQESLLYQLRSL